MSLATDELDRAKHAQQENPNEKPSHRGSRFTIMILAAALLVPGGFLVWMRFHPSRHATVDQNADAPVAAATPTAAPAIPSSVLPVHAKTVEPAPEPMIEGIANPPGLRPLPPRLQAIVFSPQNPSAIIDGRTVFLDSRVGDFRVTAITATSVTLANAFHTNVLSLVVR